MGTGLMIEGQLFVILLFFTVFQIMLCFKFPVMFGNKNKQIIPVFLFMKLGMGKEVIDLGNIYYIQIKTLEE